MSGTEHDVQAPNPVDSTGSALRRIRVLIVGGGATGQVYGYHLSQGGAVVDYYLKPRHVADAEVGYTLHRFGMVGYRSYKTFEGFDVFTRPADLEPYHFDQIWLCVSSPALRSVPIAELDAVLPGVTWVMLQPGMKDREYMLQHVPEERLVTGMIGLVAYQAPLPGEDLSPPGIAYWLPPLSPSLFSGPRAEVVAAHLRKGGMAAGAEPDVSVTARFASGALIPFVIALEAHGWSTDWLRRTGSSLELLCGAIDEVFRAVKRETGASLPSGMGLLRKSWVWKMALFAAPKVAPFPVDEYFRFHFTKVREQTETMVDSYVALCAAQEIEPAHLIELRDHWYEQREPDENSRQPKASLTFDADESGGQLQAAPEPDTAELGRDAIKQVAAAAGSDGSSDGIGAPTQPEQAAKPTVPDLPSIRDQLDERDSRDTIPQEATPESTETIRPALEVDAQAVGLDEPTEHPDHSLEETTPPPTQDPTTVEAPVQFKKELPKEDHGNLSREDFIQTELADDADTWSPDGVSDSMKSFGGSEPALSPALKDDSSDDD